MYFGILLLVWGEGGNNMGLGFSFSGVQLQWNHENLLVDEDDLSKAPSPSSKIPKLDILEWSATPPAFPCPTSVQMCVQLWSLAWFIAVSHLYLLFPTEAISLCMPQTVFIPLLWHFSHCILIIFFCIYVSQVH